MEVTAVRRVKPGDDDLSDCDDASGAVPGRWQDKNGNILPVKRCLICSLGEHAPKDWPLSCLPPYPHTLPYAGERAVLATKHGKLDCIAPSLAKVGLMVEVAGVDTDVLGTFTGEVPRTAPPLETAIVKARLGMAAAGLPFGLASEGSFPPHPAVPWVTVDREIVVLVDDRCGLVVAGCASSTDIVAASVTLGPGGDLAPLAKQADLPTHAVTVVPNQGPPRPVHKGLRRASDIQAAVISCAAASSDGLARAETDFRAHCCPRRRTVIQQAASDLAARLAACCPACGSPGWGRSDVILGVPCSWCGGAVEQVRAEINSCPACRHRAERPVVAEGAVADPGACPRCNP